MFIIGTFVVGFSSVSYMDSSDVIVRVNASRIEFKDAQPYKDSNGRVQVPVRFVGEKLKADVAWNGDLKEITMQTSDTTIKMRVGENKALVNGAEKVMDTAPVIKENRTFVPARFAGEFFGKEVEWISEDNLVVISDPKDEILKLPIQYEDITVTEIKRVGDFIELYEEVPSGAKPEIIRLNFDNRYKESPILNITENTCFQERDGKYIATYSISDMSDLNEIEHIGFTGFRMKTKWIANPMK